MLGRCERNAAKTSRAPQFCELRDTKLRDTVIRGSRCILFALATFAAACGGGGKPKDTYARATDVQGQCCEHLAGGSRDTCLKQVVRVDDVEVVRTSANQATYACVVEHFECDPASGHPTQRSAQAQLECIQDLQ